MIHGRVLIVVPAMLLLVSALMVIAGSFVIKKIVDIKV